MLLIDGLLMFSPVHTPSHSTSLQNDHTVAQRQLFGVGMQLSPISSLERAHQALNEYAQSTFRLQAQRGGEGSGTQPNIQVQRYISMA